ncbi:Bug family tripartite tricarboxylate transporter substrate binding protein [Roseomonas sp. BN140053]|uniref:Bug family tripartite tricarboxylate transporter substrate binding protein n=1 Tax=Roseomonas sp. BN140053 TaxID=3391898 RepID=UPI0039E99E08
MLLPATTRRALGKGVLGLGALGALAAALPARAQTWPSKPLRWLVGYPPGGATDIVARLLANAMGPQFGHPIVVENRPGSAGIIAAEAAAKSQPDGGTALTVDMATMVYNRALYRRLPYDPARDLAPVSVYARFPFFLVVAPQLPVRTAAELVAYAKSRNGAFTMTSVGVGSPHHLGIERFKRRAGFEVTHVPYRGGPAIVNDMAAGTVEAGFLDYASSAAALEGGRLRAVAAAAGSRIPPLLDVPTLAEQGFPDCEVYSYHGAVMPAGTPAPVLSRFRDLIAAAVRTDLVSQRVRELGAEPMASTPEEFRQLVEREAAIWLPLIRELGITLD